MMFFQCGYCLTVVPQCSTWRITRLKMLDIGLSFLKDEINTYLLAKTGSDSVKVSLSAIVDDQGKYAFDKESLALTVINIEEERIFKSHLPEHVYVNGQHVVSEPELKINLMVMFAAHFTYYDQALKYLAHVLTFFQSHPYFTVDHYPHLDPRIVKLTTELQSLGFEQMNQVWAYLGGKYLPSVVFKIRLLALRDEIPSAVTPPITKIKSEVASR